jgi:hypothetical protein
LFAAYFEGGAMGKRRRSDPHHAAWACRKLATEPMLTQVASYRSAAACRVQHVQQI